MLGRVLLMTYILFILWSYWNANILGKYDDIFDEDHASPMMMYNNSSLNPFGAFVVWFLFFLINPIYYISYFICWLFTVGRSK